MRIKTAETICDICGKSGAQTVYVTKSYGKGLDLLVKENAPVVSCPNCGESYLTAKTLHTIENIKRDCKKKATERLVPVVVFA